MQFPKLTWSVSLVLHLEPQGTSPLLLEIGMWRTRLPQCHPSSRKIWPQAHCLLFHHLRQSSSLVESVLCDHTLFNIYFAHPQPLSPLQGRLAPRSEGKARAELRPQSGTTHVSHTPAACSFPGAKARSWAGLGEARPAQSSLSAGGYVPTTFSICPSPVL